MAYLEIELGTVTPKEAAALCALFSSLMTPGNAGPGSQGVLPGSHAEAAVVQPDPNLVPAAVAETATSPAPAEPVVKRGRPRKSAPEAAPEPEPEKPSPEMEAFTHQLAIFNDQMDRGGLSTEKRREAIKVWEAKGPSAIDELKEAIARNDSFLQKKEAAHVEAQKIGQKAVTLEEVQAALKTYTEKHDLDAAVKLLDEHGCARASDVVALPLEGQAKFMEAILA